MFKLIYESILTKVLNSFIWNYGALFQADFVRIAHPDQNFMVEANEACITLTSLVER